MSYILEQLQAFIAWIISLSLFDYGFLVGCLLCWVFAPYLVQKIHPSSFELQQDNRRRVIRAVALYAGFFYLRQVLPYQQEHWAIVAANFIAIAYLGYLTYRIADYYIAIRYGRRSDMGGETTIHETYSSRLLSILVRVLIFIIVFVAEIRLLGYQSLLEAGGAIGIIGVFLALTQNVWAPDIFSGLIILNSEMMQEGDVIEIKDQDIKGVVFKTKMFHTEVLSMVSNHRIMIRNSKLREYVLHNLSRFASSKGLRENLRFNIGYDAHEDKVHDMFNRAFEVAVEKRKLPIEGKYELEIFVENCGDYAVEWGVYYYIKDVKKMLSTRKLFSEIILQESRKDKIALATPDLLQRLPELDCDSMYPISVEEQRIAEKLEKVRRENKEANDNNKDKKDNTATNKIQPKESEPNQNKE